MITSYIPQTIVCLRYRMYHMYDMLGSDIRRYILYCIVV